VDERRSSSANGSATVEHAGLTALVALIAAGTLALVAEGPTRAGERLARAVGRAIVCAPLHPGPCRRHPLTTAYGRPIAGAVRLLAPAVEARDGLVPVDFRRCRRPSCAAPLPGDPRLTTANRRTTAFVEVRDRRRAGGAVEVVYWLYRPGLGWEAVERRVGPAEIEAASHLRLNQDDPPRLVPLETLPGRNHHRFGAGERPPWQWR